jgi:iron complex outermembrane receptor protein
MTLGWESEQWKFSLTGKNLTDERYFRANFPNLFGSTIVLPELPRHFVAKAQYSF